MEATVVTEYSGDTARLLGAEEIIRRARMQPAPRLPPALPTVIEGDEPIIRPPSPKRAAELGDAVDLPMIEAGDDEKAPRDDEKAPERSPNAKVPYPMNPMLCLSQ